MCPNIDTCSQKKLKKCSQAGWADTYLMGLVNQVTFCIICFITVDDSALDDDDGDDDDDDDTDDSTRWPRPTTTPFQKK